MEDSLKGGHFRRIDKDLPLIHAHRLYGSLQQSQAYLLTQLRTDHSWLATHAKLHRLQDDDKCERGAAETVVHVLVDCAKLFGLLQMLQRKIGNVFNDISAMLGGGR